jgi:polyisoprenoid-binding protein YceI
MSETTYAVADLAGDYTIDPGHSRIGFVARHAMVTKVRGSFTRFEGTVHFDAYDAARSTAHIVIDTHSIDTSNAQRDAHLRSNEFLAIDAFPEITFTSTAVEKQSQEEFTVTGDLTVKGVSKPVVIEFAYQGTAKDPYGNVRAGFEGKATINRRDFGVTTNIALEAGGVLVGDKIELEFDISLIRS